MRAALAAIAVSASLAGSAARQDPPDPFAFFAPTVVLTAGERALLERGEPVTRVIPSREHEMAIFVAMKTTIDGERLLAWVRRIEELKKGPYVLGIGRMSDAPRLEELKGLTLEEEDVSDILDCRPGDCALKLSGGEMRALQRAATDGGRQSTVALQGAFRTAMLERIRNYLANGLPGLPADESTANPVRPAETLATLLDHSHFLSTHAPTFKDYLGRFPRAPMPGVDSFVYWSKEQIAGKPIVSATHVNSLRAETPGVPEALSATIGIFSTHYLNASLGVMAVVRERAGAPGYLVYVNRSEVDVLGGMFGGLVRMIVQRRMRSEAVDALRTVRTRLESGDPPGDTATLRVPRRAPFRAPARG